MKKGDRYVSVGGRALEVMSVTKKTIRVRVERRVLNKSTGELKTDWRERDVPVGLWPLVVRAYRKVEE